MMMAVRARWPAACFSSGCSAINFSVAVWVGYIACFGMATETGIVMLVYLREAIAERGGLEKIRSLDELRQAVVKAPSTACGPSC